MDKILVTGATGFIGFHLSKSLLEDGFEVLGIDNINDYYDPALKQARLDQLFKYSRFPEGPGGTPSEDSLGARFRKLILQIEKPSPNHFIHSILTKLST